LARMTIRETANHVPWMKRHGVRFQAPLGDTLQLGRTNAFFLGGGKALMNVYYRTAEALGVEIAYDTEVVDLAVDTSGHFSAATVKSGG
ncbi:FAD-binding dehydrogenase, partial [Klebsiella pneumoniae]